MGGIKAVPFKGKQLKGTWEVTLKIDGARMLRREDGTPVSRADKPLYNLQNVPKDITDAEIYEKDWKTSMGLVRTSVNGSPVLLSNVYSLDPIDPRLVLPSIESPTEDTLNDLMKLWVSKGYEGLILRQGDKWIKVKPSDTADVLVIGYQEGTGKHLGKMGALVTKYGKVGTGFSDGERNWFQLMYELHGNPWLHTLLIQCSFMEWTPYGKMRHPVYECIRDDKPEESLGISL